MEKAEYKEKLREIESQIKELKNNQRLLSEQYIESNAKFKNGDKVKITASRNSEVRYAFIAGFKIGWDKDIEYILYKAKKDGTQSLIKDYNWQGDLLELVDF